jgi:hypothetical protein
MRPRGKNQARLYIEKPFDEALERFVGTGLKETRASIRRAKQKKPPGGKKEKPPGSVAQNVVRLSSKRHANHR